MNLDPGDRAALADLVARYALAVDRRDLDGAVALFTDDAVLAVPDPPERLEPVHEHRGGPAIRAVLSTTADLPMTFHALAGAVFDAGHAAGTATGTVSCTAHHLTTGADGAARDLVWHLRYHDRYERADGGWRIASRRLAIVFVETRPVRLWSGAGNP